MPAPATARRPAAAPAGTPGRAPVRAQRLLVAAALLVALVPLLAALDDPDLWWHLRLGHWILDTRAIPRTELFTYTAQGNAATFHEWGSEVLFAVLESAGGLMTVALVTCVLAWTGLIATALRCLDRGAPAWAVAACVLLAAKVLQPVSGPRPQMLGFALLCWTLLIAERHLSRGGRVVWALPPLMCLWANVHGGFLYGVALLGVLTAVEGARSLAGASGASRPERVRTLGLATAASAVAACINPSGPGLYTYVIEAGRLESRKPIAEWVSPNFHDPSMWALLALIVAFALLASVTRGPGVRDGVLGAAGIAAALLAVRNSELAAALAIPGLAVMLGCAGGELPPRLRPRPLTLRPTSLAALALASVGAATVGVARVTADASAGAVAEHLPVCAAAVLATRPAPVRVYSSYADSGFLIDRGWPHLHVYDYGESVSLGDIVLADDIRISSGTDAAPSALSLLDGSGTTAVLTDRSGGLDARLAQSGGWHLGAVDHGRDLWLRSAGGGPPAGC